MPPKPGNAFAQQKELQRLKALEQDQRFHQIAQATSDQTVSEVGPVKTSQEATTTPTEAGDPPESPMTTMSMFTGTVSLESEDVEKSHFEAAVSKEGMHKRGPSRDKTGKRSFTDPVTTPPAQMSVLPEPLSTGKQQSGFGFLRSKFTSRSKKANGSPSLSAYPRTPNINLASIDALSTVNHFGEVSHSSTSPEVGSRVILSSCPETVSFGGSAPLAPISTLPFQWTGGEKLSRPSHISTATTGTIATPQSQYATLSKNEGMILGDMSLSPTRSGTYAIANNPIIVSHPSVMSMVGSVLECSPTHPSIGADPRNINAHTTLRSAFETLYTGPLAIPPGGAFHQQLPLGFDTCHSQSSPHLGTESRLHTPYHDNPTAAGIWEQLHAETPLTMPQFSPVHPSSDNFDTADAGRQLLDKIQPQQQTENVNQNSNEASTYRVEAADTKSESGKEGLEAAEYGEESSFIRTPDKYQLRKSASDRDLRYSTYGNEYEERTPIPKKRLPTVSVRPFGVLSTASPGSGPLGAEFAASSADHKVGSEQGQCRKFGTPQIKVDDRDAENTGNAPSDSLGLSIPNVVQLRRQNARKEVSPRGPTDVTSRGGFPPTPSHPSYQVRGTVEEQIAHQFNVMHHHMEADKQSIKRFIEDFKAHLGDKYRSRYDETFLRQFQELLQQHNTHSTFLQEIYHQIGQMRPGLLADLGPVFANELARQFGAHEQRTREEFTRVHHYILTLNEHVNATQRNVTSHIAQISRKLDLLLQASGTNRGHQPRQEGDRAVQRKVQEENRRRQDESMDSATMTARERAAADTVASMKSPTKTRKVTPGPPKMPVMAAALTSTPPHVPQFPASETVNTVTITDPSLPSPSAVSSARRVKHGHTRKDNGGFGTGSGTGTGPRGLAMPESRDVHPALRLQEQLKKKPGGRTPGEKKGVAGESVVSAIATAAPQGKVEDRDVLWRRPSGDGEIGGRWYKQAMEQ